MDIVMPWNTMLSKRHVIKAMPLFYVLLMTMAPMKTDRPALVLVASQPTCKHALHIPYNSDP